MTTRSLSRRAAPAFAFAVALAMIGPASAVATKFADIRVVGAHGATLAEFRQYTGTARVPTDPGAECFGEGTGGSGEPFTMDGMTAIGQLADAARNDETLRPLSITDYYLSSYGPGVCGIGGHEAPQGSNKYWDIRVDHVDSQIGAGQPIERGDDVLWYFTPTFPPPPELALQSVPARTQPGDPFEVTVHEFGLSGNEVPAVGANVDHAALPTDAQGHTMVTLTDPGTESLEATETGTVPSNESDVCVRADLSRCPAHHGMDIQGRAAPDSMDGTPGWDEIASRGGDDEIDLRDGGDDEVNCGAGKDKVITDEGDNDDDLGSNCERVVKR
jgi:hypothetical protein